MNNFVLLLDKVLDANAIGLSEPSSIMWDNKASCRYGDALHAKINGFKIMLKSIAVIM